MIPYLCDSISPVNLFFYTVFSQVQCLSVNVALFPELQWHIDFKIFLKSVQVRLKQISTVLLKFQWALSVLK
jgi:hypothetical protein